MTVPTFSMAQGVKYPGVMLLNVIPDGKSTTSLCWLPDQIGLLLRYGTSLGFTLVVLLVWHLFQLKYSPHSKKDDDYLSKEEMGKVPTVVTTIDQSSTTSSSRRCVISFIHSVKQVAWTSIIVYILCIVLL
jgi:hypothetical protein